MPWHLNSGSHFNAVTIWATNCASHDTECVLWIDSGVGLGRQEVAAATEHDRFQMQFQGMTVHEDDRGDRSIIERAGTRLQGFGQLLRRHMEGPGVEEEILRWDVAPVA